MYLVAWGHGQNPLHLRLGPPALQSLYFPDVHTKEPRKGSSSLSSLVFLTYLKRASTFLPKSHFHLCLNQSIHS